MKVSIASDHGGLSLKSKVAKALESEGYEVVDFGVFEQTSVDYPDYAKLVGNSVLTNETEKGILICTTGIGMSIAANKMTGIRAALCHNEDCAKYSRLHNNANVLCMGQKYVGEKLGVQIAKMFLRTEFEGGRHATRVGKFDSMNTCSYSGD